MHFKYKVVVTSMLLTPWLCCAMRLSPARDAALVRGILANLRERHKELTKEREILAADYFIDLFNEAAADSGKKSACASDPIVKAHHARAQKIYLKHVQEHKKQLAPLSEKIAALDLQIKREQSLLISIQSSFFMF